MLLARSSLELLHTCLVHIPGGECLIAWSNVYLVQIVNRAARQRLCEPWRLFRGVASSQETKQENPREGDCLATPPDWPAPDYLQAVVRAQHQAASHPLSAPLARLAVHRAWAGSLIDPLCGQASTSVSAQLTGCKPVASLAPVGSRSHGSIFCKRFWSNQASPRTGSV